VSHSGSGGTPALLEAGLPASDPLAARLFPPLSTGVEWGLGRTEGMLAAVGDPHLAYPTLHVGGTNGKGSVSALLASVLRAAGLRVGLYTSPHLCSFAERIQVDGRPAAGGALEESARELRPAMLRFAPTFFEACTALALLHFGREGVDVAVVEVGLGGRLDATRVIRPLVTAVTNVAMDHADYLGPTTRHIAREKAGIARPGVPFVSAETDPALLSIFRHAAIEVGAPFLPLGEVGGPREVEVAPERTRFTMDTRAWGTLRLETALAGAHQAVNGALAVRVLEQLPPELLPSREAVERGLREVHWPGRLQFLEKGGVRWVLDVAHNVAGAVALAAAMEGLSFPGPLVVVAGVLGDKDWRAMLPPIFRGARLAILTQPPSAPPARRWDPLEVIRVLLPPPPLEVIPELDVAMARAGEVARGGTVLVTGSNHTVGDALGILGVSPFGSDSPEIAGSGAYGAVAAPQTGRLDSPP